MGKVFFFIVLVAAAFAGGAMINGPGLRWAQVQFASLTEGEETPAADKDKVKASAANDGIPATPIPPLVVETPPAEPDKPKSTAAAPSPVALTNASEPGPAPVPEPKAPAPLDPRELGVKPGGEPAPPASPLASLPPLDLPSAQTEPERSWSDMPGSAPASAVLPKSSPRAGMDKPDAEKADAGVVRSALPSDLSPTPSSSSGPPPEARSSNDWAEVRRRLSALGVSRYGIEGEPKGLVRFHCVIPLAGRRAVGQQFEGEGNDEFEAALAALKRVALWRATEAEHAAP